MGRLGLALVSLVIAVAIGITSLVPADRARVTGGITRCQALTTRTMPGEERYMPGTVQVLQGDVTWKPDGEEPGVIRDVLPDRVVTQATLGFGDRYSFDLAPGHYVLKVVQTPAGNPVRRFMPVILNPGDDRIVDIPNTCI